MWLERYQTFIRTGMPLSKPTLGNATVAIHYGYVIKLDHQNQQGGLLWLLITTYTYQSVVLFLQHNSGFIIGLHGHGTVLFL